MSNVQIVYILIVSGLLSILVLIVVPIFQTKKIADLKSRIELNNKIRGTLAQIIGGAILLTGIFLTWEEISISRRATEIY